MKTLLKSLLMVLTVLVAAGTPDVAATAGPAGPGSSTGTAVVTGSTDPPQPGAETASWTATGSPSAATGTITYQAGSGVRAILVSGVARCIGVDGNRAFMVFEITASTDPGPGGFSVGQFLVVRAEDNGVPGAANDRVVIGTSSGASLSFCQATHLSTGPAILAGEIVVTPADAPPTSLTLDPAAAVNPVGTRHTVTATATNAAGPVEGTRVEFEITGASGELERSCVTDDDGRCSVSYMGPKFPGVDRITACADSNENQQPDVGEPCGEATKEWVLPVSTPGATTGGGQILHLGSTGTTFGFTFDANDVFGGLRGECNLLDHAPATDKANCLNVLAYVQTANEATVYGNATVNGEAHGMFRLHVVDVSESGIGNDLFEFETEDGHVRAGLLTEGNIQVHPLAAP